MYWKRELRHSVQAVLALSLTGAVIYLTIQGHMETDILAGLAGTAVGFYLAERKNGNEREHELEMINKGLGISHIGR